MPFALQYCVYLEVAASQKLEKISDRVDLIWVMRPSAQSKR